MAIVLRARLTEVLDGSISGLRAHCALKAANLEMTLFSRHPPWVARDLTHGEASALQPERDQIQKVHKLTENNALCGSVLIAQIAQLLNQCFYL